VHSQINYFAIDERLIVSQEASRIYRVCAWISLALFVALVVAVLSPSTPLSLIVSSKPLLMVGALSYAGMIVAMEVFLFRFDESSALKQIFWFVVMLIPLLGAPAYCLLVYSRSEIIKNTKTRVASASAQ